MEKIQKESQNTMAKELYNEYIQEGMSNRSIAIQYSI